MITETRSCVPITYVNWNYDAKLTRFGSEMPLYRSSKLIPGKLKLDCHTECVGGAHSCTIDYIIEMDTREKVITMLRTSSYD